MSDSRAPEWVELVCPSCGRTSTFSPNEPEDRRVCLFCTGQVPDAGCCADCEGGDHADG